MYLHRVFAESKSSMNCWMRMWLIFESCGDCVSMVCQRALTVSIFISYLIMLVYLHFHALGIPDCNGYRGLCWKILLGYLGAKKQDWPNVLQKKRQLYKQFISMWLELCTLCLVLIDFLWFSWNGNTAGWWQVNNNRSSAEWWAGERMEHILQRQRIPTSNR